MLPRDTAETEKERKKREKAEAKARKDQEKQEAKLRKEREKEAKKSGHQPQAQLSTSAAVFRAMPKQFIQPTPDNTDGMTDAQRITLMEHNMAALRNEAKERGIDLNRPVATQTAPVGARTEVRLPPVTVRQPTPAKKSSWFSSFCCLFTCCFGSRRKEQKESSALIRNGIN
jgi:hypothetical protein